MHGKYRLTKAAIALFEAGGHHEAITVPVDSVVELNGQTINGEKFVDVIWDGRTVMMFVADLERATVVV
jgi:hypothetical protein